MNRTAVVTGGARNIGRAVVLELARTCPSLVVNSRHDSDELGRTVTAAEKLGAWVVTVTGDVAEPALASRLARAAEESFGGADILVHVPALRPTPRFLDITPDDWALVLRTNLESLYHLARAVLPGMLERGWGRLIAFSGAQAFSGKKLGAHVVASKAGVVGLVRALAHEYADRGVTANAIVPGPIATDRSAPPPALPPVARLGRPEEVAAACRFLTSDEAGFVTGQCLHVNGGADFY